MIFVTVREYLGSEEYKHMGDLSLHIRWSFCVTSPNTPFYSPSSDKTLGRGIDHFNRALTQCVRCHRVQFSLSLLLISWFLYILSPSLDFIFVSLDGFLSFFLRFTAKYSTKGRD